MGLLGPNDGIIITILFILFIYLFIKKWTDTGFLEYAPHELQVKLITHLSNWMSNPTVYGFFVGKDNTNIFITIICFSIFYIYYFD